MYEVKMNSIQSATLIVLLASWTSSAVAGNGAVSNSGVIHFHGTIVDGGCDINPQKNDKLEMSCFDTGKTITNTAYLNTSLQHKLPLNRGTTELRWIDHSKKTGILTVSYN